MATVRQGWSLGTKKVNETHVPGLYRFEFIYGNKTITEYVRPAAELVDRDWDLYWVPDSEDNQDVDIERRYIAQSWFPGISWPFTEQYVSKEDFINLGFMVIE